MAIKINGTTGITTPNLTATTQVTTADLTNTGNYNGGPLTNRNMVINGAMQVAQRGTTSTTNPGGGYWSCDRWLTEYDSGNISATFSQASSTSGAPGFIYSHKCAVNNTLTLPTSSYLIPFEHRFERAVVDQLAWGTSNAKPFTLSFWIKSNRTGTYTVNPTLNNSSPASGESISKQYTIDAVDTWEYKEITFPANTIAYPNTSAYNSKALTLFWWMAAGSTYSSGTLPTGWQAEVPSQRAVGCTDSLSSGDYWEMTGVQMEVGENATPFEHLSYGDELAKCQRYYQFWGAKGYDYHALPMWIYGSGQASALIDFPQEMRAPPSMSRVGSVQNSSGGSVGGGAWAMYWAGGWRGCSALTAGTISHVSFRLDANSTDTMTAGDACGLYGGTDCYFTLNAEL